MIANQEMSESARKQVIHVWDGYGKRSQTWLYRLLSNMLRWTPSILTKATAYVEEAKREQPWPEAHLFFWPEFSPLSLAVDRLRSAFRTHIIPGHGSRQLSFLNSLVEARRFNIVHLHSGPSFFWDSLQTTSVPKVVSFYGSDILRRHRRKYMKRLQRLLRQPYTFVVTSHALLEGLELLGAPRDRIQVIPVGIDLHDFPEEDVIAELRQKHLPSDIHILTVGRLTDVKAPHMLPQVARMLLDRGLRFRWTMVGDGPLKRLVANNVSAFGVEHCFHMLGSLPFSDVKTLLRDADLMVHNAVIPPHGGREALGVVLQEAAAMGLPVVSCRVGGIPEVVLNGETGFLVEQGDHDGMADHVFTLAQNRELRIQMGIKAMKRARALFDTTRLSRLMEDLYDTLMAQQDPSSPVNPSKVRR